MSILLHSVSLYFTTICLALLVEKSTSPNGKNFGWPLLDTIVIGGSPSPPSSHPIPGPNESPRRLSPNPGPSGSPRRLSPIPGPSGAPWSSSPNPGPGGYLQLLLGPFPGPNRPGSPRGAGALRLTPPSHPPPLDSVVFGQPALSNSLSLDSVVFGQPARSPSSPGRSGAGPNRRSPSPSPVGTGAGPNQLIHPVLLEMMPLPGQPGSSTNPGTIRPGPTQKWLAKAFYGGLIPIQRLRRKNYPCSTQSICIEGFCCLDYGRQRKRCKPLGKLGDPCSPIAHTAVYSNSCPCGPLEGTCVDGVCK
ncbi:uncharacterized protein LOC119167425 isoform X2 [Rhipicephalus microplus]|uniref:uncharacterized protein LOC119167425 isoform X2 n=1 Tax=Rhipicephalus microplus TaxID=6941 RepID=UPI003F6AEE5B